MIIWDRDGQEKVVSKSIVVKIPAIKPIGSTSVLQVYPTSPHLPMNQLKLYIELSNPMSLGKSSQFIKLFRMPDDVEESEAFLITHEELWDPERKRLTIFFDPGRIKRGVQPNLQLGLPLVEGRKYKLVISKNWQDRNGANLIAGFEKEFEVVAVDRKSPDPKNWLIQPPKNSKESLKIDFRESLDYGLLHSSIVVLNQNQQIDGTISLLDKESVWVFTPAKPWTANSYEIHIDPWLEDLAGNSIRRKFDVNLEDPNDTPRDIDTVIIPFQIETTKRNIKLEKVYN